MSSTTRPQEWTRPESPNILISSSQELIQPQAVNAAFDSDFMYWTKPLSEPSLAKMLENSLCYGVYNTTNPSSPKQIGFARLITDKTTFAYLTDVYILPSHQSQGLGKWLVRCIQFQLDTWPDLRGTLLYCDADERSMKFYQEGMGMQTWVQGSDDLVILKRRFRGSAMEGPDAKARH